MDFVPRTVMIGGKVFIFFIALTGQTMHSTHSFQPSFVCSFFCFIAVYSVFPYTFIIEHNALLIHKGWLEGKQATPCESTMCCV